MGEQSRRSEGPTPVAPPGTPRWVKVFGVVGLIIIVLVIVLIIFGGPHGPSRHTAAEGAQVELSRLAIDGR